MSTPDLPSIRELKKKNIPFTIFVHDGPVHSLEQAASERNQLPEQVVRSLLFRLTKKDFALILVAGPAQIPWKTLRDFFGQRRLTLASKEEVKSITGYAVGTVSPFGLRSQLPIYIESSLTKNNDLSMGSGKAGTAIMLQTEDLLTALPNSKQISLFA
jgi:Cys-tRNA(Pro) deacylase